MLELHPLFNFSAKVGGTYSVFLIHLDIVPNGHLAMSDLLLGLAKPAQYISLNPDGSYYNVLDIQTKTENRNGISQPCSLPIFDQFSPSDANICSLMDNTVWMYHAPEITGKDTTSELI